MPKKQVETCDVQHPVFKRKLRCDLPPSHDQPHEADDPNMKGARIYWADANAEEAP